MLLGRKMKKIYSDTDMIKMGYYRSILESNNIQAYIKNEASFGLAGPIPWSEVYPELWVINDSDLEAAVTLLKAVENKNNTE
jgi:hypothetical protein